MHSFLRQIYLMAIAIGCVFFSCDSSHIPSAPGEPFAQNRLWITNNSVPKPGTAINGDTNIQFDFEVAFTIVDSVDVDNRSNNFIAVDFIGLDTLNQVVRIGGFPDNFFFLGNRSGIIKNSLSIAVPGNLIAVGLNVLLTQVNAEGTIVLASDFRSWPVNQ